MRLSTKKREAGELEFGIIFGTIALVAIGAARFLPLEELAPPCLFRAFTGLSCPTCGATRSLVNFSHGNMLRALSLNPLMTIVLSATIAYFVVSCVGALLKFPRIVMVLSPFEKNVMSITALFLFLVNWTYLISSL
jgi:hypothetical protein